jgi:Xaa-Pro aminopeptidase
VAERVDFKIDTQNLEQFDKVLLFEFKNDIRNQTMYVLKEGTRYKVDDPNDLFDLKTTFREAINFPNDYNRLRHEAYQTILEADNDNLDDVRNIVQSILVRDSLLMEDEIIKDFLKKPAQNFYVEAQRKTAFALRDYNFDMELLSAIMADMREVKSKSEIDLLKKSSSYFCSGANRSDESHASVDE